jgi:hypothetical protein
MSVSSFFWIAAPFFTIWVISSMSWTGRHLQEFRKSREARELNAKYLTRAHAYRPLAFVSPAAPFPLRNEDGPRDWTTTPLSLEA